MGYSRLSSRRENTIVPQAPARPRKKQKYVDFEPRLRAVGADGVVQEDATGVGQTRADYAIRLGLGDPDQLYYYRQCILDPERAVQNPQLRQYVAEVTERALRLIFDDPQMWSRAQQLLRRQYPNQVYARMSEAAHSALARRAGRLGIPMDEVVEAWNQGLDEGGEQRAFARASSRIDKRGLSENKAVLQKIRKALRHG